jgi:hypothetical protein
MNPNNDDPPLGAWYDRNEFAIVIRGVSVRDWTVVTEARRWSTGQRGVAIGEEDMVGIDLSSFVAQSVIVGAHAIATAGGVQDTFNLEQLVTDAGARTAESTSRAVESATTVMNRAAEVVRQASSEAKKAIVEAGKDARQNFADNVDGARKLLLEEVQRLVGGEHPELAARLEPMLATFGHDLDARAARQTSELFATAARQFDPSDPTSPMSKHTRELHEQQRALSSALEKNLKDLAAKVDELASAVKTTATAKDITTMTVDATPLKGRSYAAEVHEVMAQVAKGLGDEYVDTGAVPGTMSRNKKGDAVLAINGGSARIVLEMTTSKRPNWNDYLDEAERNRKAIASLGLVREPVQNNGSTVRCLGSRRLVLAFDPATDDPELLRTVIQLLRISALAASTRQDRGEIHTADEKITEAIEMLAKIDDIKKVAGTMRQNAGKIEQQSEDVRAALTRLLTQAQSALSAAGVEAGHMVG